LRETHYFDSFGECQCDTVGECKYVLTENIKKPVSPPKKEEKPLRPAILSEGYNQRLTKEICKKRPKYTSLDGFCRCNEDDCKWVTVGTKQI
jgi:hypothetical protein